MGLLPLGGVASLVSAVDVHPPVVGLSGSGAVSSLGNIDNGGRKKIRLTKKSNVRKRFGVDPWEQPIPKSWKADTFGNAVFHGHEGGIFCSGSRLELADHQVAQSHACRRSACRFLSVINAWSWSSGCG